MLGLFSKKKTNLKSASLPKTSLSDEIRIKETLGIRRLETMPVHAARAFQLASDPKATLVDFVKVIESDEALSARIIRIANSVYFRRGEEAKDIEKAVANVGLNELRCLISANMLRSLLQGKQQVREQIWANAVATGICCRLLCRSTEIPEGEAFLCGLLHDVGKLLMIRRSSNDYEKVLKLVSSGSQTFIEAEDSVFDLNHVEVGKWISEQWHFPQAAVRAITFHHNQWPKDPEAKGKGCSNAMLVKACDILAHAAGIGHAISFRAFANIAREEIPKALEQLSLGQSEAETILSQLQRQFNDEYSLYQLESL